MSELAQQPIIPFKGDESALTAAEIAEMHKQIPDWEVLEIEGIKRLQRVYSFPDFVQALAFTNTVGALAETAGHHPALLTEWGKVTVSWWTHFIGGVHQTDFILAARTDGLR